MLQIKIAQVVRIVLGGVKTHRSLRQGKHTHAGKILALKGFKGHVPDNRFIFNQQIDQDSVIKPVKNTEVFHRKAYQGVAGEPGFADSPVLFHYPLFVFPVLYQ